MANGEADHTSNANSGSPRVVLARLINRYGKGQKYTLLSRKDNLALQDRKALKTLLPANKRLYVELLPRGLGKASLDFGGRQVGS